MYVWRFGGWIYCIDEVLQSVLIQRSDCMEPDTIVTEIEDHEPARNALPKEIFNFHKTTRMILNIGISYISMK